MKFGDEKNLKFANKRKLETLTTNDTILYCEIKTSTYFKKNTIKAGGSTAICKMLTGVGDGVDTP